jgi:SNF2 family DNA or RNA helicase
MFVPNGFIIRAALRKQFEPWVYSRGHSYYATGHVQQCLAFPAGEGDWIVQANVRGSQPQPYRVQIVLGANGPFLTFKSTCTCSMKEDCKHAVAALLYAANNDVRLFGVSTDNIILFPTQQPSQRELSLQLPPKLDPAWELWLKELEHTAAESTPTERPAAQAEEQLLYLLKLTWNATLIEVVTARPLKKGGYGVGRSYSIGSAIKEASVLRGVQPADRLLLRKIVMEQGNFEAIDLKLDGKKGPDWLRDILGSGKCFWQDAKEFPEPLSLGEPIPARPAWRAEPTGEQVPYFETEIPVSHVLRMEPPWYVNIITMKCGPLETALPAAVALAWLSAPRVRPESARVISEAISSRPASVHLPTPVELKVEDVAGVTPTPCLRLYSTTLKPRYSWVAASLEEKEFTFAALEFDYGGFRATADHPPVIITREGEVMRRLIRNLNAEEAARKTLFDYGFSFADAKIFEHGLGKAGRHFILDDPISWFEFTRELLPKLEQEGWKIEKETSFRFRIVEPEDWYSDASAQSGSQWFEVELGVVVEGEKINLLPVIIKFLQMNPQLLSRETLDEVSQTVSIPVALPDGRLIGFPMERIRSTLGVLLDLLDPAALNKKGRLKISRLRAAELAAEKDWRWMGAQELQEFAAKLRNFQGIQVVPPPPGLQTQLRPYQQEGLSWLQFLREYELAGILADDMGLGKTVQALAHLLVEKDCGRTDRPSLVVAPTSLMTNWRQEAERFAPALKVLVLHGLDRKQHFERIKGHDLVITSYPLLARDEAIWLKEEFHYVILDEAQYIKNAKTTYAQVACSLKARHHLCLTGTPMENHLGELWSLFNFLLPGFLGDEHKFNSFFRRPIEKQHQEDRRKLLARRVAPFILRRRKEDVVKELPPKTEIIQKVELTSEQRDLYESVRLAMHARVKDEVARKGMSRSHIIILDALLKLRQICCHPQLLSLPSAKKVKESAKLDLLLDLLPEMIEEGRRILLFSQFTSMLAIIQKELNRLKIPFVILTGETTDRATPIERFQNGEVPVFLISLKAGGTGLNLTAADTVIHYDPWWNPAVENQATDRAHRIGQTKKVFVYKLLTEGTVEEKILALQGRKKELVEGLLNEDRKESLKLSQEDIDLLFSPLEGK